jgi:hypothetical protein
MHWDGARYGAQGRRCELLLAVPFRKISTKLHLLLFRFRGYVLCKLVLFLTFDFLIFFEPEFHLTSHSLNSFAEDFFRRLLRMT